MKKGLLFVLIAICAVVGGISGYQLVKYYNADRAAEADFAALLPVEELESLDYVPFDGDWIDYDYMLSFYEELCGENSDMVGWLSIPGTRIGYPVMQTPGNPEYYLDRNFKKEYSAAGSLFASAISNVGLPSDVVVIYGHRMKTGAMFGSLGSYLKADFLAERETIIFDTFTERNRYKVYAAFAIDVGAAGGFEYYNYSSFEDESAFDEFMKQVRSLASAENPAYQPVYGDKLLLLSTCEYTHEDGRLVIVAVKK